MHTGNDDAQNTINVEPHELETGDTVEVNGNTRFEVTSVTEPDSLGTETLVEFECGMWMRTDPHTHAIVLVQDIVECGDPHIVHRLDRIENRPRH